MVFYLLCHPGSTLSGRHSTQTINSIPMYYSSSGEDLLCANSALTISDVDDNVRLISDDDEDLIKPLTKSVSLISIEEVKDDETGYDTEVEEDFPGLWFLSLLLLFTCLCIHVYRNVLLLENACVLMRYHYPSTQVITENSSI